MKKKDMHSKSAKQLNQHAEKLGKELAEARMNMITKGDKNVRNIRKVRRERARALTIATEKTSSESEEK